jgi:O-antigen/teichoic acid export membrane protein
VFFGAETIATQIFENQELIPLIKILSFTIPIGIISRISFDTTLGYNKIIYKTGTVRILQNIVQLTVTVILLLIGFEVASAAWGWLAGTILAAILGLYFMEKKIGPIITSKIEPKHHRKKILRFSAPLLLSGMIGKIMGWADTGLLGYYMTDFEVGLYNAALPTAMLIMIPHSAIGSLAVSSFSELKERNEKSIEKSLQTATYWAFSIVFPTFLLLLFFSDIVLRLMWGNQYTQASFALSILALGYLIDALMGRIGSFLQSTGYTKYLLYNNIAALIINILLNVLLIPIYGIIGAAIATASSTILTNLMMFAEVWKKEGIVSIPYKKIVKIIISGLIPLFIITILDRIFFTNTPYWFLLPAGIIYFSTYSLMFLKILGIDQEEKEVFIKIGEMIGFEDEVKYFLERLEELL